MRKKLMSSSASGLLPSRSTRMQKPIIRIIERIVVVPSYAAMSSIVMAVRIINTQYSAVSKAIRTMFAFWPTVMGVPSSHLALLSVFSGQVFTTVCAPASLPIPSSFNYLFSKRHGYHLPKVIDGWLEVEMETFWVLNKADVWTGITIAKDPPWVTSAEDNVCYIIRYYPQNSPASAYMVCNKPTIEEAMSYAEEYYNKIGLSTIIKENL